MTPKAVSRTTKVITIAVAATVGAIVACSNDTAPTLAPRAHFTAVLSAANERQANPVTSTATGLATLTLRSNDSLDYIVNVSGLTGPATASHIHAGAPAVSGPVVNGFAINPGTATGTVASGTIILSQLVAAAGQISGDSLRVLLNNGNGYVNVHTAQFGAGEIRGQITLQP